MSATTLILGLIIQAVALWLLLAAPIRVLFRLRRGRLDRRWAIVSAAGYVPGLFIVRLFATAGSIVMLVPWVAALVLATIAAILVARHWNRLPAGGGARLRPLAGSGALTLALLAIVAVPLIFG